MSKPIPLNNEKYRETIISLYKVKEQMHVFDKIAIEDMKYKLDIACPIGQYDIAWLESKGKGYLRG